METKQFFYKFENDLNKLFSDFTEEIRVEINPDLKINLLQELNLFPLFDLQFQIENQDN